MTAHAEAAMDVDDDVPSPRTLRAAAERLAQYTSETEEPAAGAHDHFADLYSEVTFFLLVTVHLEQSNN